MVLEETDRSHLLNRKRNTEIIGIIKPKSTLEYRIVKSALSFFGHNVRADMMELQLMLGRMEGRRVRGRPHGTCLANIKNIYLNISVIGY